MKQRQSRKGLISTAELSEILEEMPEEFIDCREQHRWVSGGRTYWNTKTHRYVRLRKCERCATFRHQEIDEFGGIIRTWYEHPENYLIKGKGRIGGDGRNMMRLHTVLREIEQDERN